MERSTIAPRASEYDLNRHLSGSSYFTTWDKGAWLWNANNCLVRTLYGEDAQLISRSHVDKFARQND